MNTEKTIKEINSRIELDNRRCLNLMKEYIQALKLAMEALRKQEPTKPVPLKYEPLILHGWEYGCPACEKAVGFNKYAVEYTDEDPFCPSCGQAIDWSEE